MSHHIKKKKKHFAILTLTFALVIFGFVEVSKGNNFLFIQSTINQYIYKYEYQRYASGKELEIPHSGAGSVPVLVYHGITKDSDRFNVTLGNFKSQMFALKKAGYQTITLNEFIDFRNGIKELPKKSFLLTFDDGRIDSYVMADPILKAIDFTAVMYVTSYNSTNYIENRKSHFYLSSENIRDMLKTKRWEIGSHAVQVDGGFVSINSSGEEAPFLSNRKWIENESRLESIEEYKQRVYFEIADSKKQLEDEFSIIINSFSYPFGDYGQQAKNEILAVDTIRDSIKENYNIAFKQIWPNDGEYSSNYSFDDPIYLERFETPTNWSGDTLVSFLDTIIEKELPYKDNFVENNGWKRSWGEMNVADQTMRLYSTSSTTGAQVFLEGTKSFNNYLFTSYLEWISGSHVSLTARQIDSRNYLSCNYSDGYIRLEEFNDGKSKTISEVKNVVDMPSKLYLSVAVEDDFARCLVGQDVIVFGTINNSSGGVGLKIWDEDFNNASILVKNINIESMNSYSAFKETLPDYPTK